MSHLGELVSRFHHPTLGAGRKIVHAVSMLEYVTCWPPIACCSEDEIKAATECFEILVWKKPAIGTELYGYWMQRERLQYLAKVSGEHYRRFAERLIEIKLASAESSDGSVLPIW